MSYDESIDRDGNPFRDLSEIEQSALSDGLRSLAGFDQNPFLRMQAFNLNLVDGVLNKLEQEVHEQMLDEELDREKIALLSALSEMWILSAYEVLRTWKQSATEIVTFARDGGLAKEAERLSHDDFLHYGQELRVEQLRMAIAKPELVEDAKRDLSRIYMSFTRLEFLRVAIAKHEVSSRKKRKPIAFAPSMARINRHCGSMEWELSNGGMIIGEITRREVAESIRFIPEAEVPSQEDIESFKAYMSSPPI